MEQSILMQTIIAGILMGGLFALIAVGLSLIWGVMEIVNFAHGEYMMIAMFLTYGLFKYLGLIPIFSIPITAAILGGLGILTYRLIIKPVLKGPMVAQIVVTFGVLMFLRNMGQFVVGGDYITLPEKAATLNGLLSGSIKFWGLMISRPKLVAFVVSLVFVMLLDQFLKRTPVGKALRATAQNRKAAQLIGINIEWMFAFSWWLGMLCVCVGGVLLSLFHYIHPEVGLVFTLFSFIIVTLGGFGSIWGVFAGGLIIGLAECCIGVYVAPAYKFAVAFMIFVLVLLIRPQGLFGKE